MGTDKRGRDVGRRMEQPVAPVECEDPRQESRGEKRVFAAGHGAVETLCFLRDVPCGIINSKNHFLGGEHSALFLTQAAQAGEEFPVAFECYAGHHCPGTQPYENYGCDEPAEGAFSHVFRGVDVLVLDEAVHAMCFDLMTVLEAADLPADNFLRRRARAARIRFLWI